MVTRDSQEEVLIFRYKQTDTHFIIIYISSSAAAARVEELYNIHKLMV